MIGLVAMAYVGMVVADTVADEDTFGTGGHKPKILRTTTQGTSSFGPPPNDECTGAISIPSTVPVCSSITTDVLSATPDPTTPSGTDPASCLGAGQFVANTIWYTWVPPATGFYRILSCSGASCGPGTTQTTDDDGVIVVYSAASCAGPFTSEGCNDDGCHAVGPSIVGPVSLNGGQTYFIMAGNWTQGDAGTAGQIDQYQIRIELANPPANDQCANAEVLTLNAPTSGFMNQITQDNYQPDAACFSSSFQVGNVVVAGTGRDVTYSFTAPTADTYSFYLKHYNAGVGAAGPDALVYLSAVCPAANGPITGADCIYAANRATSVFVAPPSNTNNIGNSEEAVCVPLTAGQTVYVIVDEANTNSIGTTFGLEVSRCVIECEFNGTPAAADDPDCDRDEDGTPDGPNSASAACPVEGRILTFPGFPDVDFYSLGLNPGSRLFSMADCDSMNPNNLVMDLDMRVTTTADTLEFDDADNGASFGTLCPNVAGTPLPLLGSTYIRINAFSTAQSFEPYRLHTAIRAVGPNPPMAGGVGTSASPEAAEPNDTTLQFADYVYGTHGATLDYDYYAFSARRGDYIMVNVDGEPTRDTTAHRSFVLLFDPAGNVIPVPGLGYSAVATSVQAPSPGTLTGVSPRSNGDAIVHRAATTGVYIALPTNGLAIPVTAGDYLYQVSLNCNQGTPGGGLDADMAISKTGPATANAGENITYTIVVTNNGPNPATLASWSDNVPAGTTFVALEVADGWTCVAPDPGNTGPIECAEDSGTFDGSATFTLTVNVPICSGNIVVSNTATTSSATPDSDPSNNSSTANTNVTDDGTCSDGDACTVGDACQAGVCVGGGPRNCDDSNACTDDSCDSASGCVNTNNTGPCDDGNACTGPDSCSGGACSGANLPAGTACETDNNACTNDGCNGNGVCAHVPNTNPCDDNNACTSGEQCHGGVCGGGTTRCCDDGNICTDDSCDPAGGCINACNNNCNAKGQNYWKRLCRNRGQHDACDGDSQDDHDNDDDHDGHGDGHHHDISNDGHHDDHGDDNREFFTSKDVDCVNNSCTFSDVQTVNQMCDVFDDHHGDRCTRAEKKFMSLLLNVCRCRLNPAQTVDSRCHPPRQMTVGEAIANSDATLCNPNRTSDDCRRPECVSDEVINGEALWQNTLRVTRQGTAVRLTWSAVYGDPVTEAPRYYRLWMRQPGGVFTMIGQVNASTFTYLHTNPPAGTSWYEITATY